MTGPTPDHVLVGMHGTHAERVCPGRTTRPRLRRRDRKEKMAGQPGERPVTADIGAGLIKLMLPNADLELVQLIFSHAARGAADGRADHECDRDGDGEPRASRLQECAELIALIRAVGIDRAEFRTILELNPEIPPAGGDTPHPPIR
jgi:hypothetical protein